jgi:hypothetical protein
MKYKALLGFLMVPNLFSPYFDDISGIASNGQQWLAVSDGGEAGTATHLLFSNSRFDENDFCTSCIKIPLATSLHNDLEGTSFFGNNIWGIMSSFCRPDLQSTYKISFIKIDSDRPEINSEFVETIDIYNELLTALKNKLSPAQYQRMRVSQARLGGLNVEGFSRSPNKNGGTRAFVLGLRSPLFSPEFGDPERKNQLSLSKGNALIAQVDRGTDELSPVAIRLSEVNLGGQGIRSLEWIDGLNAFAIISGPATKGTGYKLWLFNPLDENTEATEIKNSDFSRLHRPESLFLEKTDNSENLVIVSERAEAPESCSHSDDRCFLLRIPLNDLRFIRQLENPKLLR